MKWLSSVCFLFLLSKDPPPIFAFHHGCSRAGTTSTTCLLPPLHLDENLWPHWRSQGDDEAKGGKMQYWTVEEKDRLRTLRRKRLSWESISAVLGRSPSACSQKYSSIMKESYWSPNMHTTLLDLVVYYGENWTKIEQRLLDITGHYACADSCRLHYLQCLRLFHVGPWDQEEIQQLLEIYPENDKTRREGLREIGYIENDDKDGT